MKSLTSTFKLLWLLLSSSHFWQSSLGQTEIEIGEYPASCLQYKNGAGTEITDGSMNDKDLTTVYRVAAGGD